MVIEVSDTGPGVPRAGARASVRGVPGLDPAGRLRPRPRDRGRAGARPWRRDPPGRRHHRGDVPHHHPGPRGGYRRAARGAGEGLAAFACGLRRPRACGLPAKPQGRGGAMPYPSPRVVRTLPACGEGRPAEGRRRGERGPRGAAKAIGVRRDRRPALAPTRHFGGRERAIATPTPFALPASAGEGVRKHGESQCPLRRCRQPPPQRGSWHRPQADMAPSVHAPACQPGGDPIAMPPLGPGRFRSR